MRTKHDLMNRKCIASLCRLMLASGNIATVQQRRTPAEKQAVRLMGKKSRLTGGAVGRRTILQLSPPGSRSGNVGERDEALSGSDDEQESDGHRFLKDKRTNMKASTVKATEGLSLLGAYEDSDEEDVGDSQRSTANPLNRSADIDSTLANFMAEIDAITTQPSTDGAGSSVAASTPPRPEVNTQQTTANEGQNQQVTEAQFEFNTQYSLAGVDVEMGDWQEVWDENSGCYYYWNTVSNEVSWELPHYLANQVQSLAKYANSTGVNGNGTAHAGQCTEESTQASAKETKIKKDVIESVVGLTSEEEERRGVAASLLGPLIPSEVKEAEEKWRKRLLKGLDEPENSLDSDGDGICPAGSPLAPVQEQDSVPVTQKDLVKKQSRENSDAEETEEDTMELELALERKKAELRALEEGDGSAGGSSPCSETSQEAAGSRVLLKKNRWKTAFPSVASPDSNSRGSEQQESIEPVPPKALESVVEDEDKEPEDSEEKTGTKPPVKEEVETPELKFQIGELANTLTSKMEFLGINKKAISNFQLLLLQTETRIADWREGALNGVYLRRRLQEAAEHIKYYELNATPKGWSCHWDREHRRYFYVNDRSGASQWDFPTEDDKVEDAKGSHDTQTSNQVDTKPTSLPTGGLSGSSAYPAPPAPPLPTTTSFWPASQPPLPDSPPPPSHYPPPPPLPPGSPPPPPPLPDSDSEIMEVEMEMDDDDGEPPAPGTEEDGSGRPPLPPGTTSTKIGESSGPLGKGQKRKAGQMNKTITIGSSPILYTQPAASAAPVMPVAAYWAVPAVTAPIVPSEPPVPPVPALPPQPPLPLTQPPFDPPPPKPLPTDKTKKAKKDKQSKKIKTKMPSLVKKWQSIQKELDEEEKSSSSDEDRDQLNKKSIEEWKQQQLVTGKASKNANFEALPEDWRERLKKRKMNST